MKTQRASASKGASILLFGPPGHGKTRFIGTGPHTLIVRPPDDHTDSIVDRDNVEEIVVRGWPDLLGDGTDDGGVRGWLHQGAYEQYQWVWLDSLSLWQGVGLRYLFDQAVERNPNRAEFGLDKPEYGINQFRVETFIRDMVGMAGEGMFNFGVVCHTMEWWNPFEEKMYWAPNIQGREGLFMSKISGMMNTVAFYYRAERDGQPVWVLRTQAKGKDIFVKDQLGLAPKGRLINPTMDDINDALSNRSSTRTRRRRTRRKSNA